MRTIPQLPQAIETESIILGACLTFPEALHIAVQNLSAADFAKDAHRTIFESIKATSSKGIDVDLHSVAQEIMATGKADQVGGISYLSSLTNDALGWRATGTHCAIVKDKAIAREAIKLADQLKASCFDGINAKDAVGYFGTQISRICNSGARRLFKAAEITGPVFEQIKSIENGTLDYGIQTGFTDLDRRIVGMAPGNLIILAARPSMGKTALAVNIGTNVAASGVPVLVFSMEMSKEELILRMASAIGNVGGDPIRKGFLNNDDWQRLNQAKKRIDSLPMLIDDEQGLSISKLTSKAKMEHIKAPVGMIIVDYLQLMRGERSENRTQEISEISRGLKGLAKDMGCPVLALSQLNRSLESRSDKRPILSDLRESGSIEQDADTIHFIYRDAVYNEQTPAGNEAEIITAKQRHGPTGRDFLLFQGEFSRFVNKARDE